ncbi:hypothetical protein B0T22DRAFT_518775 [Podospora appendiculata]|uniref:Uncharacterized protein n=1 Tax=Podospora appendiculata TaxID=314037 RepID=A0AAE1CB59_9PEZI|nr:hypothetical protein B0T22DRAFT_518775 [Podospora appendiculata]
MSYRGYQEEEVPIARQVRNSWTDKTDAVFYPADRREYHEYPAADYPRELDFKGCRSIVFLKGERTGGEDDTLLLTNGSGHITLPAGVQVLVTSGFAKCEPAYGSAGAGSAIGVGVRAPPPSRVGGASSSYAGSAAGGSSYSRGESRVSTGTYRQSMPSPPRDGASFSRVSGGYSASYVSARNVPLPQSTVSGGRDYEDDNCSIAPSESVSSVGSRRAGGSSRYSYY